MSFRTRLTLFFVLIVVVPMVALGVVVVRLIGASEAGKADARAGAYAAVATHAYERLAAGGEAGARRVATDPALAAALRNHDAVAARRRARSLAPRLGLTRLRVEHAGGGLLIDTGDPRTIAPGAARSARLLVEASTVSASRFAREAASPAVAVVVRRAGRPLAASLPAALHAPLPTRGGVTLAGRRYTVATFRAAGFAGTQDTISVLAHSSASGPFAQGRWLAIVLLVAFLALALAGALLISRQLHGQLAGFLLAARRIGDGDLSTPVPVEGNDEFAALAREFNKMSCELEERLAELGRERGRLRESIQRIGAAFAANLDRAALLEIGTHAAVDAVEATCGRATVRATHGAELLECARVGELDGAEPAIAAAEAQVRERGVPATATIGAISALAVPIAREGEPDALLGLVAVARPGRPFDAQERELVASLSRQTGVSLENVELHDQVKRQAVTDELTGLFNHRRFQEVVATEVAAAQRFGQPLGLVMLDVDDFKAVNDTYGHQQGDVVLREVARILRESTREIDEPARYGGEEMAVALPQTDLDGAQVIAERVRTAVEALALPRLDGGGILRVTVSCGVAASADGDKDALIAAADAALYAAKRAGKNRTICAPEPAIARGPAEERPPA